MLLVTWNKESRNSDLPWKEYLLKKFLKENFAPFMINVIVGIIFILSKDDLINVYAITRLSVAILGFGGGFIWQSVFDTFNPGKKTAVGINKK